MSHRLLDSARIGALFQTVGGIRVSKLVRQNRNFESASRLFDGALDVGFMHPIPDHGSGARVATGVVSRCVGDEGLVVTVGLPVLYSSEPNYLWTAVLRKCRGAASR
jgi:hypothetical protein